MFNLKNFSALIFLVFVSNSVFASDYLPESNSLEIYGGEKIIFSNLDEKGFVIKLLVEVSTSTSITEEEILVWIPNYWDLSSGKPVKHSSWDYFVPNNDWQGKVIATVLSAQGVQTGVELSFNINPVVLKHITEEENILGTKLGRVNQYGIIIGSGLTSAYKSFLKPNTGDVYDLGVFGGKVLFLIIDVYDRELKETINLIVSMPLGKKFKTGIEVRDVFNLKDYKVIL